MCIRDRHCATDACRSSAASHLGGAGRSNVAKSTNQYPLKVVGRVLTPESKVMAVLVHMGRASGRRSCPLRPV
eukprot:5645248-Pyramimonas_sp.AAC.2